MSKKKKDQSVVKVPFHGGEILLVTEGGQERLIIKSICDVLSVDFSAQSRRVVRDPRLATCVAKIATQLPGDGQRREVLTIPRRRLAAFLYGIQPGMVKDEKIRANLLALQDELEDVMAAYFEGRMRGATKDELLAAMERIQALETSNAKALDHNRTLELSLEEQSKGAALLSRQVGDMQRQMRTMVSGALVEVPRTLSWVLSTINDITMLRQFGTKDTIAQVRGMVHEDLRQAVDFHHLPWEQYPFAKMDDLRRWLFWLHRRAKKAAKRRGFGGDGGWSQPPLPFAPVEAGDEDDDGDEQ